MEKTHTQSFALVIIGAGPGGIAAAKAAALRGLRVALINYGHLMGYGLEGAFKSKSLYEIARAHRAVHHRWSLAQGGYQIDFDAIYRANQEGAQGLRHVHRQQLIDMGVALFEGFGTFVDPHTIAVMKHDQEIARLVAEHIIVATGTRPRLLPGLRPIPQKILTSDEIVDTSAPAASMLVLGAGVIGCEFASIFAALGTKVTLLDTRERIFSHDDEDISALLQHGLRETGVEIIPSIRCKQIFLEQEKVHTLLEDGREIITETALLAIGRTPNVEGLHLERAGIRTNAHGSILVSDTMQTNIPHIYAVGDLGLRDTEHDLSLVHVAEAEGRTAIQAICGEPQPLKLEYVPFLVFTLPMIAGAGLSEHEARKKYGAIRVGKWSHTRNHRAHAMSSHRGFVKLIVAPEGDDRVLGVRGIGDGVDAVIGEVAVMIQYQLPYTCLLHTTQAHPSFSESLRGAADLIAGHAHPYQEDEEYAREVFAAHLSTGAIL